MSVPPRITSRIIDLHPLARRREQVYPSRLTAVCKCLNLWFHCILTSWAKRRTYSFHLIHSHPVVGNLLLTNLNCPLIILLQLMGIVFVHQIPARRDKVGSSFHLLLITDICGP